MPSFGAVIRGIVRTTVSVLPLIGYLPVLTNEKFQTPQILWPPIGSVVVYAPGIAAVLIWAIGELPKLSTKKGAARYWFIGGIATALIALGCYALLLIAYVPGVPTPFNGMQYRTVGSVRTPVADRCTPNKTDQDLLRCGGLEDGDIETLWTPSSVYRIRFELFVSYILVLGSINVVISSKPKSARARPMG